MSLSAKEKQKGKTSVKKIIIVLIVISVVLFLTLYFIYPLYLMFSKQNVKLKEKMFKALSDGDTETFSAMFSSGAKADPDYDENVKKVFDLVDGEFTDESWRCIRRTTYVSESYDFDYGKLTKLEWLYTFENIPTDTGKTYDFYVRYSLINDHEPQYKGVSYFAVSDADDASNVIMIAADKTRLTK